MVRRTIVALLFAALAAAVMPPSAHADEQWCESDPIFIVGNTAIRVTVGLMVDPTRVSHVTYVLRVPHGAAVQTITAGTTPFPEVVTILDDLDESATTASLVVSVAAAGVTAVPIIVTIYGPTAQSPDAYTGNTDTGIAIAIALS